MGVFAKLDGLKRPPIPSEEITMNYEKIKVTYSSPRAVNALQMTGITRTGLSELADAKPISNPNDRKIVSAIVAAATG